ncbi:MAG: CapA family protein [Candidatus Microsaccharimonas sp.]
MKLRNHRRRVWWVVGIVLIVLAIAATVSWYFVSSLHQEAPETQLPEAPKVEVKPVSITSTGLFSGNTFWGRNINQWSMASDLKTAYPFSRLNEFHRDQYDAWVTGLECPTVAGFTQTVAQEEATLSFNCSPDYLPEAAKWFTAVTLANNHTDNRGPEGFLETRQQLDKNGIQYFGNYDPEVLEDACEVAAYPVKVTYSDGSQKEQKLPVALCGYHGVFKIPSQASLAQMEKYSKIMPVIAMPHSGAEYTASPDQIKIRTYRSMIDHGADMVLGDHSHWVQNTEAYNGKLIVYSMGNFIFDQQGNTEVTRSDTVKVVMSSQDASSESLEKWLALGESCASFHDTCLQQAEQEQLEKIPFEYKFGVVGTNSANKITKPATADEQAAIEQRMQWSSTMSQLKAPYSSL